MPHNWYVMVCVIRGTDVLLVLQHTTHVYLLQSAYPQPLGAYPPQSVAYAPSMASAYPQPALVPQPSYVQPPAYQPAYAQPAIGSQQQVAYTAGNAMIARQSAASSAAASSGQTLGQGSYFFD